MQNGAGEFQKRGQIFSVKQKQKRGGDNQKMNAASEHFREMNLMKACIDFLKVRIRIQRSGK